MLRFFVVVLVLILAVYFLTGMSIDLNLSNGIAGSCSHLSCLNSGAIGQAIGKIVSLLIG